MAEDDLVFLGTGDNPSIGPLQVCCMHDPYDLCCPVCGKGQFSHDGGHYTCETCGVDLTIFPDRDGCRIIIEVQGA